MKTFLINGCAICSNGWLEQMTSKIMFDQTMWSTGTYSPLVISSPGMRIYTQWIKRKSNGNHALWLLHVLILWILHEQSTFDFYLLNGGFKLGDQLLNNFSNVTIHVSEKSDLGQANRMYWAEYTWVSYIRLIQSIAKIQKLCSITCICLRIEKQKR